jgi:uncharacterized protein with von Willebrand factor type A (vWA) domain
MLSLLHIISQHTVQLGGLNLAQNSVNLKAVACYSIVCITDGGLNLAQNSVNLKAAAYYTVVCITDGGLNLTQNSVNLKAAAYYSIVCITDGGLSQAHISVNPKSQGQEFNPALSSSTNHTTATFVDMFMITICKSLMLNTADAAHCYFLLV